MAKSRQDRIAEAERFARGCRDALALLYGPTPSEKERREAAKKLGRTDHLPDPQDSLNLEPRR